MRLLGLMIACGVSVSPNREFTTEVNMTTPFTTVAPNTTDDEARSNVTTTPFPVVNEMQIDNGFDMGSFFGGVVLTVGVTGTAYFGTKFYKANHPDYRHI